MRPPRSAWQRIGLAAWFLFLAVTLVFAAVAADRHAERVLESPFGCDSFGYLQMARQIRRADDPFHVRYHLEYSQTRQLVDALKALDIPRSRWEEAVAPHAHHYFPVADAVGPQYPPGTALVLSAFPEGVAVRRLNAVDIGALLAIGLTLIAVAAWKQSWVAAGFIAVATACGLDVIAGIRIETFSINAMIVPLVLAVSCTWAASWCPKLRIRIALAVAAGACLGLAVLIRLPIILVAPGLLIFLLPDSLHNLRPRRAIREPSYWFLVAIVVCGVIPVLFHQHAVAGAWYCSTYGTNDSALPSVSRVPANVLFYLTRRGLEGLASWQVLTFAMSWILAARAACSPLNRRFVIGALMVCGLPVGYFLTHGVTTDYYLIPTMFATVWLLGLDFPRLEATAGTSGRSVRRLLAAIAAAILIGQTVQLWRTAPIASVRPLVRPDIPAEFHQGKPWIWADLTSGTIVYCADVPTFKVTFADRKTRLQIFKIAFAIGERQYIVVDCPAMQEVAAEIERAGGRLEPRGEAAGAPYSLIEWPADGPESR